MNVIELVNNLLRLNSETLRIKSELAKLGIEDDCIQINTFSVFSIIQLLESGNLKPQDLELFLQKILKKLNIFENYELLIEVLSDHGVLKNQNYNIEIKSQMFNNFLKFKNGELLNDMLIKDHKITIEPELYDLILNSFKNLIKDSSIDLSINLIYNIIEPSKKYNLNFLSSIFNLLHEKISLNNNIGKDASVLLIELYNLSSLLELPEEFILASDITFLKLN